MCDSKLGLWARVPIGDVEVNKFEVGEDDGQDGQRKRIPTSFRGIVKRSFGPVEETGNDQCEEKEQGLEEAFQALEV